MKTLLNNVLSMVLFMIAVLIVFGVRSALSQGQKLAHAAQHKDMQLVGFNDLQARSTYQPTVHKYPNGRYVLFAGAHGGSAFNPQTKATENNGTGIVDVTDPANPVYLKHLPGPSGVGEAGGAQMVRVCNGSTLPNTIASDKSKIFMLRSFGNDNHQVWDVTDPSNPVQVGSNLFAVKRNSTHKSWWECDTGIAYVVAGAVPEGWKSGHITWVFNLSNPRAPVLIRKWALDGHQPGSILPTPPQVHGPISAYPFKDRVYYPFGVSSNGVFAILDRTKLINGDLTKPCPSLPCEGAGQRFEPTSENLNFPVIGRLNMQPNWGGHTAMPFLQMHIADFDPNQFDTNTTRSVRDIVALVSEATANGCREFRHLTFFVDVTSALPGATPGSTLPGADEKKPQVVSNFQVPESDGNFCDRGGRFGPHATNENFPKTIPGIPGVTAYYDDNPFYNKMVFISYFNAGVRALDIRDPLYPVEVAFYIPATTDNTDFRCVNPAQPPDCPRPIQTNNVDTDDRGLIYIVDRANTGVHIVRLSGDAWKVLQ